jgi:hypothetical protein
MYELEQTFKDNTDASIQVNMTEVGLTAEYCLLHGTPSVLKIDGVEYFFAETCYDESLCDVSYFEYVSAFGRTVHLFNR